MNIDLDSKRCSNYYVQYSQYEHIPNHSRYNEAFGQLLFNNSIQFEREKEYDNKRFDFRLKNIRTFVEIDPSYTHSIYRTHWDELSDCDKSRNEQLIKTLVAEKYDYRCIHVFDWDSWDDIIELLQPVNKIYARKCHVTEISPNIAKKFIKCNDFYGQWDDATCISLGLYYNDQLVQVITFRKSIRNKNYQWELLNLCTMKGLSIIGGASKLFNYAINNLQLNSIIAYCDRAKFTGQVFYKIGMHKITETEPIGRWSNGIATILESDLTESLVSNLFNSKLNESKSIESIMLEQGWLLVYDCGEFVFAYGQPLNHDTNEISCNDQSKLLKAVDDSKEKLCKFCGEPFVPKSNFQKYCKRPHYMTCPVCNKPYLVANNENLKRPPVACSYACRAIKIRNTSLEKYGTLAPGNNPEARKKSIETMQRKFGVDYAMQSSNIKEKSMQTMIDKYGVDNIQKLNTTTEAAYQTKKQRWRDKVHSLLPRKVGMQEQLPKFKIDDDKMSIFLLTEKASTAFLSKYGFNIVHKFGKIHMSVGLVNDGILYQLMRFEKVPNQNKIMLVDFGIRDGYFNPNYYTKLFKFATQTKGIEEFSAKIPRNIATDELLNSMSLKLVNKGDYEVYWKIETKNKLVQLPVEYKRLTQRDDIEFMLQQYDYVTTDYIDTYEYLMSTELKSKELYDFFAYQFTDMQFD